MTDNEIKKGLELTIELILNNKISQLNDEQKHHTCFILASALDAIDVKNEAMQAAINGQETLQEYIAKQDKEIERLKAVNKLENTVHETLDVLDDLDKHLMFEMQAIKAEAYKEFAERLKEKVTPYSIAFMSKKTVYACDIDNLLKEMVGEDK